MSKHASRKLLTCMLLAAGLLAAGPGGCRREDAIPPDYAVPPPRSAKIRLDTPQQAARSLLLLLQEHLQAVARDEEFVAIQSRDQIVWHILAQRDVMSQYEANPYAYRHDRVGIQNTLVENWAATIAFYAEGLDFDGIESIHGSVSRAAVRVPARHGDDQASIEVACVLDDNEEWRVLAIDFEPPAARTARRNATQPATTRPTP